MNRSPWAWPPEGEPKDPPAAGVVANPMPSAIDRAVEKVGSMQALANALGITLQAVWAWKRAAPPRACPALSVPAAGEAQP